MYVNHLNYYVDNVLKRRYPWIKDYSWRKKISIETGYMEWSLYIIPDEDFALEEKLMDKYETEIWEDVVEFFVMVKDSPWDVLQKIKIIKYDFDL